VNALFTFETTSAALNCGLVLKELQIECRVIPVPRALASSCTYAIVAEAADIHGLCARLRQTGGNYRKAFRVEVTAAGKEVYEEIRTEGED
jgi:hypothetical protein